MKIFVGNLSFETTDADLRSAFATYGEVASAQVIVDKYSMRSRGFGFVEMNNNAEATAAMAGLNGKEFKGRPWTVNEARERRDSPGGGQRSNRRF
jgi:RNA recognition motif-containing protein